MKILTIEEKQKLIEELMGFVKNKTHLVHKSMIYQCKNGHQELIFCGFGVEGPDKNKPFIASPFMATCSKCNAPSQHISWSLDSNFSPTEPIKGTRFFAVPENGPDINNFWSSFFSGEMREAK